MADFRGESGEAHPALPAGSGNGKAGEQMGLAGSSEQTHATQFSRSIVIHWRSEGVRPYSS